MPVALIHKSVVKPANLVSTIWTDEGTGSPHSVTLKASPHMGTAWPSSASLLDRRPIAHEIKPCFMQKIPYLRSFLPLFTQRTFVDIHTDDEDVALEKRKPRASSWPPCCRSTSRGKEAEEEDEEQQQQQEQREFTPKNAAQFVWQPPVLPPGTTAPVPSLVQTPRESSAACTTSVDAYQREPSTEMDDFMQHVFKKLVLLSEPSLPNLGSSALPSVGSAAHYRGACKPCAFAGEGCRNGTNCDFCHLCIPKQKKRGRWNLKRRRKSSELDTDFAVLGNNSSQADSTAVTAAGAAGSAD